MIDSQRFSQTKISPSYQIQAMNQGLEERNQFISRGLFLGAPIDFDHPVMRIDQDEEVFKEPTISENMYKVNSELKSSRKLIDKAESSHRPPINGNQSINNKESPQSESPYLIDGSLDNLDKDYVIMDKNVKQISTQENQLSMVWRYRALPIIHFVTKFAQQLKTRTDKFRYRLITRKMFWAIGDPSGDYDSSLKFRLKDNNHKNIQQNKIIDYLKCNFEIKNKKAGIIIQPDSSVKIVFDFIFIILLVLNIFYVPLKVSFQLIVEYPNLDFLLETFPNYAYNVHILINLNTAYYKDGVIQTVRKSILKHYFKRQLLLDVLTLFSFIIEYFKITYAEFFIIFRIVKVRMIIKQFEDVSNMNETYQQIFDIAKLTSFIVYVAHFCGCAWHFLGYVETKYLLYDYTWLAKAQLTDSTWLSRYIASVYWSTITVLTVGYGDVTPVNDCERVFVIFVALSICGSLGYSISSIGFILQRIEEKKSIQRKKIRLINQYTISRGLKKPIQIKVRKYFEHYFRLENEENYEGERYMGVLTKKLKEEVLVDMFFKVLKNSRIIGENLPTSLINSLCLKLKEKKFTPEEDIFAKGEPVTKLIFVLKGEIQLYAEKHTEEDRILTSIRTIKQGFVLGEREFLMNQSYAFSAKALKFTQIAFLEYYDFIKIIKDDQLQLEKFQMIKDNLLFNENYKGIGRVCEICLSSHSFQKCPFVFFQPNIHKIVADHRKQYEQNRRPLVRFRQKTRLKLNLGVVQDAALEFIINKNIQNEIDLSDNLLMKLGFVSNIDDVDRHEYTDPNNNSNKTIAQDISPQPKLVTFAKIQQEDHIQIDDYLNGKLQSSKDIQPKLHQQIQQRVGFEETHHVFQRLASQLPSRKPWLAWKNLTSNLSIMQPEQEQHDRQKSLVKSSTHISARGLNRSQSRKKSECSWNGLSPDKVAELHFHKNFDSDGKIPGVTDLNPGLQNNMDQKSSEQINFNLDIPFSARMYFPGFNLVEVIKRINQSNSEKLNKGGKKIERQLSRRLKSHNSRKSRKKATQAS